MFKHMESYLNVSLKRRNVHEPLQVSQGHCTTIVHEIFPLKGSGPTLNFQKSQDLVAKKPKTEQKFPSCTENTRNGENENTYIHKYREKYPT